MSTMLQDGTPLADLWRRNHLPDATYYGARGAIGDR